MENNTSLVYDRILSAFQYIQFVFGIIGAIGNVLVIIVFSQKSLRKYAYSFYCLIMAISDIGFMSYTFIDWIGFNFGAKLELVGTFFCKIVYLIPSFFADFSTHLLTIIAIDRMISIVYSRRLLFIQKRWFQSLIVAISALFVMSKHIILPLYSNIIEIPITNSSQTIRVCKVVPDTILNIHTCITLAFFVLVNIIINNWLNIKAIRFIMASRKRVNGNSNSRNSCLSIRDRKFAVCSICLNLASMILKLPFFLAFLIIGYSNLSYKEIILIIKITGTFAYIDNGFSFFINMYVNSLFYEEFLRLFGFRSNSIHDTISIGVLKSKSTT